VVVVTDDRQDVSNESVTPKDRAMSAMQNAAEGLADAHAEADNAAMAGAAEQEHVTEFVDEIAQALADGLNDAVGFYAGAVAEEAEYYSKTDLKQQIKDRTEELRGSDKQPLDEFVEERLETVTVVKTTDHRQGAEYIFDFGTFKVETRSGKDGRGHFRFDAFRNLIHESGGVNTAPPVKDRRGGEEWRDFMVDMISERGEEQYTRGARTKAFEALRNKVKRLTGYGTPESALDHTGVWVVREEDDLPEWWQAFARTDASDDRDLPTDSVSEVRVHESVIEPILEDVEITRSALYHELNARNLTVPGTSGASMSEWVNGSDERFWTLLPDLGTPRTYVPDPNASAATTGGLLDYPDDGQGDDQPEETEHAGPVDAGAEDAHGDGDGFDSVGDTA
jgi:nucleoid DNA-binding protein